MNKIDHSPQTQNLSSDLQRIQTGALVIIAFAVVLFLLVQARSILISLATAIILFSLMSDVIRFISRLHIGPVRIPNLVASVAAVVLIAAALLSLTSILLAQVNTVLVTTLSYAERAPSAVASLFSFMGPSTEQAIVDSLQSVQLSSYISTMAGQAGNMTQATVLVILFVGFLFGERIWSGTKLDNFVGDPVQVNRIERIITSIIRRVNYYLLVKVVISAITGVMIFVLAILFGLELAVALGVITFVLNFIPNVGSIAATALIALVAHVQVGDAALTAAVFFCAGGIQFLNGNIIDPLMMGRALRLSAFGIILSLAFWGAVWGIPGMFLSVPIMVMLLVVCSHVPALRPLAILLSREGLPESEKMLDESPQRDLFS